MLGVITGGSIASKPDTALWFMLRFACVLSLLMYPWPAVGAAYGEAAGALGNLLLGDTSASLAASLHFARPGPQPDGENSPFSTELQARRAPRAQPVRVPIDLRILTYVPTAVFIALALATPMWRSSRGPMVLLLGMVLLHGFLITSIVIPLLLFFAEPQPMHLLDMGNVTHQILDIAYRSLVAPPGMAYAVPTLLWLLTLWLIRPKPTDSRSA